MAGFTGNPKAPTWYGNLGKYLDVGATNVFYVDGIGPNTNGGLTPDMPLGTIRAALDLCTADNDDYIIILDYWAHADEAWPIVADVSKVHLIGCPGAGAMWPQINPTGDLPGIRVTAHMVEIANLSVNGGVTSGCIETSGDPWGTEIHHCWFGEAGTGQDGIRIPGASDAVYLKVWANRFGAGLTRNGVNIAGNATRGRIGVPGLQSNFFHFCGAEAIIVNNQFAQGGIFDNRIAMISDTQGYGITLTASCASGVMVDGNSATYGDSVGNNPYLEAGAANNNNWGRNYHANTMTLPA
jgi:hypothetical protein